MNALSELTQRALCNWNTYGSPHHPKPIIGSHIKRVLAELDKAGFIDRNGLTPAGRAWAKENHMRVMFGWMDNDTKADGAIVH